MNSTELQNDIIKKILEVKDIQMLQYLKSILSSNKPYELTEIELQLVKESEKDYENQNTVSNEEVFQKTDKWLEE